MYHSVRVKGWSQNLFKDVILFFWLHNSINILNIMSRNVPKEGNDEKFEDDLQSKIQIRCIKVHKDY